MVGTVLLGTLLVSVLMARVQLNRQARQAQVSIQACQVLDELLRTWWADPSTLPRDAQGRVPNRPEWRWRTQTVQSQEAEALYSDVLAVEVFAPGQAESGPAAGVEILLPIPTDENATTQPTTRPR